MTMSTVEFDYLRKLVREQSAIVLDHGKEYLVEARLAGLVREQGMSTVTDLVAKLRGLRDGPLHTQVVEAITTNETLFFRDPPLWDTLRKEILPELVERRRGERRLNVWSAACSSGQEPYSLAMLLAEHFPALAGWDVSILGTDLSTAMLARAREGSYSQLEVNRGLPAAMLVKHFDKEGMHWRVGAALRRTVEFRPLNLDATWPPLQRMDLVLLRNVLIYFDATTKLQIVGRMRRQLQPDGYLVLGAAENLLGLDDAIERMTFGRTICYRPRQG
ncbi:MAG TPA: protein-glutamate O-methyltransferase CheR [Actinomycetes bacterium]